MATQTKPQGWSSLFWTTFKRSNNPMVLLDENRRCVEVNGAFVRVGGYPRKALVGSPVWNIVKGGPRATEREWKAVVGGGEFFGETELVASDGAIVAVHFAAHPATVAGHRVVLFVTLDTARHGRYRRAEANGGRTGSLTKREREVVHLVALGHTSRQIADELHIAHDTARTHVRNAQTKLGARSRAQLVAIALGEGHNDALDN